MPPVGEDPKSGEMKAGGERQPGIEGKMKPQPGYIREGYKGGDKLKDKVAIITGGDSGIGRSVAVHFAREGANAIAIVYLDEHNDAEETKRMVESEGARAMTLAGDVGNKDFCCDVVQRTMEAFGRIDILVNNAGEQHVCDDFVKMNMDVMEKTFRTNIFSMFYLTQAALEKMGDGGVIINSTSVTAYKGMPTLVDYSSTKGAIVAFTRSLSQQLLKRNIRVNAVAPGPIWTPLIPATFPEEKLAKFDKSAPMERIGQPWEVGPSYVFLASDDSTFFSGQVLHPNGASIVNG